MASPSLEVGTKNRRVTLESPSQSVSSGNATVTWTTQGTVWAEFEGLGGTILGTTAEGDARFRIWFRSDITPRWRIGLSGTNRKFHIQSIRDPDGRRNELIIFAREVLS